MDAGLSDIYSCIINIVVITTQPMNDTVCLTQSRTASFTCVVDRRSVGGIISAGWQILDDGVYQSVFQRPYHMSNPMRNGDIITDTLTVTNVSVDDNGTLYRCQPYDNVTSMNVTITVLGELIVSLFCPYV